MKRKEMRPQRPDNLRAHRNVGKRQRNTPHYINFAGFGKIEVHELANMVLWSLAFVFICFAIIWLTALACVTLKQWGWF